MLASKLTKTSVATLSVAGLSLFGALPAAQASEQNTEPAVSEKEAIEQLEENLSEAADEGDAVADESLEALHSLDSGQLEELGVFLTSDRALASYAAESDSVEIETDVAVEGAPDAELAPASYTGTRNASCTNTVSFLGINFTQMEMTGNYSMNNGNVTGTNSMGMRTVYQYEPFASTEYSNYTHSVVNGNAQFQGTATVSRGAGWDWSTRSGVYQMTAYGPNNLPSCGFIG